MDKDLGIDEITASLSELNVCVRDAEGNFRSLYEIMCEVNQKISKSFSFSAKRKGYDALDAMSYAIQAKQTSNEFFKNNNDILLRDTIGNELDEFLNGFHIIGV